jgi:hypothetical protein
MEGEMTVISKLHAMDVLKLRHFMELRIKKYWVVIFIKCWVM